MLAALAASAFAAAEPPSVTAGAVTPLVAAMGIPNSDRM